MVEFFEEQQGQSKGGHGAGVRRAKPHGRRRILKNIDKNIKKCDFLPVFEGKNDHFMSRK